MPHHPRPYTTWGYPVVPILFIAFASFYVISTIWNDINNYISGQAPVINSLLGIGIIAIGAPLFWYFRKKKTTI
jgi:APA family basic amino acid/polyamine antiporter